MEEIFFVWGYDILFGVWGLGWGWKVYLVGKLPN